MIDLLVVNASEVFVPPMLGRDGALGGELLDAATIVADGAVAVDAGRVVEVGRTDELVHAYSARRYLDAGHRLVTPGFVDAHSHLVHGGSRLDEYEAMLTERPASLAGGIGATTAATALASDDELRARAEHDLDVMLTHGTTTLEAKTGYGRDATEELRLLRITAELGHRVDVLPTFQALHVRGVEAGDLPSASGIEALEAAREWAASCDVCCDPVGFDPDECESVAATARALGYSLRVHADQTGWRGGAELAGRIGAVSADHLDHISDTGIAALAAASTVAVVLPGVQFHMLDLVEPAAEQATGTDVQAPLAWRRWFERLRSSGVSIALAGDYNAGSCRSRSMQSALQLGARLYRVGYAALWNMATIGGARALGLHEDRGSLVPGHRADLVLWRVERHGEVIHRTGENLVAAVVKDGIPVPSHSSSYYGGSSQ